MKHKERFLPSAEMTPCLQDFVKCSIGARWRQGRRSTKGGIKDLSSRVAHLSWDGMSTGRTACARGRPVQPCWSLLYTGFKGVLGIDIVAAAYDPALKGRVIYEPCPFFYLRTPLTSSQAQLTVVTKLNQPTDTAPRQRASDTCPPARRCR